MTPSDNAPAPVFTSTAATDYKGLGLGGKKFIVTGGTRGIGRACVELLLAEGADVAFCARSAAGLASAEIELRPKGKVHIRQCDVRDARALQAFIASAVDALGQLDGLVCNVSGGAERGLAGWQNAFDVDVMASVRASELAFPHLKASGGSIVMISSIMAAEFLEQVSPYAAGKAALAAYASQLGGVYGRDGVRVNTISPGPIYVDDGFWGQVKRDAPDVITDFEHRHPLQRLGRPDEVAQAVAFLLSPRASWFNRANLVVDGGFSKRIQF